MSAAPTPASGDDAETFEAGLRDLEAFERATAKRDAARAALDEQVWMAGLALAGEVAALQALDAARADLAAHESSLRQTMLAHGKCVQERDRLSAELDGLRQRLEAIHREALEAHMGAVPAWKLRAALDGNTLAKPTEEPK